jgi:hypothetical protein
MKSVFRVNLAGINPRTGAAHFINFECRYPTLEHLVSALNDGSIVFGEVLRARPTDERGVLEVIDRRPFALAKGGFGSIATPNVRFVEYDDLIADDAEAHQGRAG